MNHTLKIVLDEKDEEVVRYLMKEDGVTLMQELKQIFYCELENIVRLYGEEAKRDKATRCEDRPGTDTIRLGRTGRG